MLVTVLGLGRFGSALAKNLSKLGADVIGIDNDMEIIESIKNEVADAVCVSSTDEAGLIKAGVLESDAAVVAIGEDVETSILTTAILRRLGIMLIYSRATTSLQEEILKEVGARETLYIEEQMAAEIAKRIMMETTKDRLLVGEDHLFMEVDPPEDFYGRSILELQFEERYHVKLVAIKRKKRTIDQIGKTKVVMQILDDITANITIENDDTLLLFGKEKQLKAFY